MAESQNPTRPDRLSCVKTGCRRTFKREPDEGPDAEVICGKCWRTLVPPRLRNRSKRLRAEISKAKRRKQHQRWDRLHDLHHMNWRLIKQAINQPQRPAGLDAFLERTGL